MGIVSQTVLSNENFVSIRLSQFKGQESYLNSLFSGTQVEDKRMNVYNTNST